MNKEYWKQVGERTLDLLMDVGLALLGILAIVVGFAYGFAVLIVFFIIALPVYIFAGTEGMNKSIVLMMWPVNQIAEVTKLANIGDNDEFEME